ncbi:MAG: protein translocase subunit SecD [Actinobacteria bacterium]|nr:MAG: protein translocase subunit SecD [Actinomycetota bacterium]
MSNRRSHLTLVGLIVAALAGVALLAIPGSPGHKKAKLGLDLQGGLEVVLKAVPPKGHKLTASDMDRSVTIMRQRINKLGVSENDARKQGKDQIVIELPGVKDAATAAKIIGSTAQLQFYDFEADVTGPSTDGNGHVVADANLYHLLQQVQGQAKSGTPNAFYLFDAKHHLRGRPAPTQKQLLATPTLRGKLPKGWKVLAVPEHMAVVSCAQATRCDGVQQSQANAPTYYYLMKFFRGRIPEATGNDLKLSAISAQVGTTPSEGTAFVQLGFNSKGNKKFQEITQAEAFRGQSAATAAGQGSSNDLNVVTQYAQHFAIVLDGEIKSTPYIDYKQNPNGIDPSAGGAEISNINSIGEAKNLALVLQTGALPVNFVPLESTDVSATLGKDSLQQAKTAALIGLLIVALFLLVLYRFLGVVAVVGLGIYAAFLYGAILLFGVTLTLPGFAGLILTIGVAADANVVIFERIKEEVRSGKSVRAGIAAGYAKGFHTIVDANVVTLITALVLFAVATQQVKGFALMLMIGTLISLVTAVAATRAMLGLLAGFRWFENPSFMGAHGQQTAKWLQIDFMRRRYLWFAISGVIVAIGIGALSTKGLNLGIDFKGGTQVTFKTHQPVSLATVRAEAATYSKEPVVQGRGKSFGGDKYESFQIRLGSLKGTKTSALKNTLQTRYGQNISIQIQTVSSSFGRQIARSAVIAILFSLLLIVLYIAIRFDFKFAVPVIVALLHDIAITVGVYSLTGRQVSNSTVAAVLTVLGYSIYDTIIIFDRIRENVKLMARQPFATIANVSLWETIRRSLATTFITLLPIASLLVFGGATLKDFAFALMVGIVSGAYSSIFIAAPLLTIWKEREPDYARRREQAPTGDGRGDGKVALEEAEEAAAAEPAPSLGDVLPQPAPAGTAAAAKRERRRQRRRARPHGRAR